MTLTLRGIPDLLNETDSGIFFPQAGTGPSQGESSRADWPKGRWIIPRSPRKDTL